MAGATGINVGAHIPLGPRGGVDDTLPFFTCDCAHNFMLLGLPTCLAGVCYGDFIDPSMVTLRRPLIVLTASPKSRKNFTRSQTSDQTRFKSDLRTPLSAKDKGDVATSSGS